MRFCRRRNKKYIYSIGDWLVVIYTLIGKVGGALEKCLYKGEESPQNLNRKITTKSTLNSTGSVQATYASYIY